MLLHGIPLVLSSSPLPEMLRKAAAADCQFTLAAVPALWQAWHEARCLYEKPGFTECADFGDYVGDEFSMCMSRAL